MKNILFLGSILWGGIFIIPSIIYLVRDFDGNAVFMWFFISFIIAIGISALFSLAVSLNSYLILKQILIARNKSLILVLLLSFLASLTIKWEYFGGLWESLSFWATFVYLFIFQVFLVALYFRIKLARSLFERTNLLWFGSMILVFLTIYFYSLSILKDYTIIYWPGSSVYEEKVNLFPISEEDARNILEDVKIPTMNGGHAYLVIGDYYYYPRLVKIVSNLGGYYVNGYTGMVENRFSNYSLSTGFMGPRKESIPKDIFTKIEILSKGAD